MESLAHFIESLKTLELNIYITNTHLEPLIINQYVPKSIEALAKNPDIKRYIEQITADLSTLNALLEPIANETKNVAKKTKAYPKIEPYASFAIDEEPIVKQDHYHKDSFETIMTSSPKAIKPLKRRVPFEYKGNCPVWKAYIYHNIARDRFLYDAINNTLSASSWLNEMDKAIEYRWRVNHQLSRMESDNHTTHLKTHYAYQESLAKLIKYNLLMALNQPIYDTHGGMLSKGDDYGDLTLDIPITNYPRLKPYLAIFKANAV